jgi:anaerobic magnesium-protoporphyrin IX monomethyl ester cyclase
MGGDVRILLINPPLITDEANHAGISYGEPLGLAYIAAAIEASGRHQVEVLDAMGLAPEFLRQGGYVMYGLSHDELLQRMRATSFDVVGITITKMYEDNNQITRLCGLIKKEFPSVPLIAGGPDVTLDWAIYMELGTLDYAVLGEGEATIVQLLDYLDGRGPLSEAKGLCYRENGRVKMVPQGPPIDIEDIPWPARHHFPMENYFRLKPQGLRKRSAAILTSRACPYSCAFCSTIEVWGRKWRGRDAKDVVDEIEHLVRDYGAKEIVIFDDNFLVDRNRAEAIADGIIARRLKIGLHIAPGLMIHLLSVGLLRKLRKAGLIAVTMQLESGNKETLAYIDKHIEISKAKEMVRAAHFAGLGVYTNVLLGFFFEDRRAIEESIRVAESVGFDNINYQAAEPKPGTRMYNDWVKAGIFKHGDPAIMPVDTLHFKGQELTEIIEVARRNQAQHQARRFYRLETWYGYLIPKYLFYPRNLLKLRHDALDALKALKTRKRQAA